MQIHTPGAITHPKHNFLVCRYNVGSHVFKPIGKTMLPAGQLSRDHLQRLVAAMVD